MGVDELLVPVVLRIPVLLVERTGLELVLAVNVGLELQPWLLVEQLIAIVLWLRVVFIERTGLELVLAVNGGLELQPWILVEQLVTSGLGLVSQRLWRPWVPRGQCSENLSGFVYLIANHELSALKIGVASDGSSRLDYHFDRGWVLRASWPFASFTDAFVVEEAVLDRWRNLYGTPPAVQRSDMRQGGWTETMTWTTDAEREIRDFVTEMWRERRAEPSQHYWSES